MKTKPSHYVLAAEVLIIILFHTVKIRQEEKHSSDTAFVPDIKTITRHKPVLENRNNIEYMLVNLIK
ncbi:MAG TPA: hypothetical protein VK711_14945 [Puia sp.]|jgi:hypothetical protein|nr:hypothetical protein [Puia sp.]